MEKIEILLKDGETQKYDQVEQSIVMNNWFIVEKDNFQFIIPRQEIKEVKTEKLPEKEPKMAKKENTNE